MLGQSLAMYDAYTEQIVPLFVLGYCQRRVNHDKMDTIKPTFNVIKLRSPDFSLAGRINSALRLILMTLNRPSLANAGSRWEVSLIGRRCLAA